MALDVLALGPFVFTAFAVPERLPLGGKQQLNIKKMPGGDRVADALGPDDRDRQFSGIFAFDGNALDAALTLDALRISGAELPYSNGAEARLVVIAAFEWDIEKFNVIHFSITLTPVDNPGGSSASPSSLDSLVQSDLSSAFTVASDNTANSPAIGGGHF